MCRFDLSRQRGPGYPHRRSRFHCPTTRKALYRVQALKKSMIALAVTSITLSCGMSASNQILANKLMFQRILKGLVPLIPLSSLAAAGLNKLEKRFFVSFKRKDQMRTESGL